MSTETTKPETGEQWRATVAERVAEGARFAGLYGTATDAGCRLTALLATPAGFDRVLLEVRPDADGTLSYPSLTVAVPSAFWYERAAADLSGVTPVGHPRLDPLLLPVEEGSAHPRPGQANGNGTPEAVRSATPDGPVDVHGRGLFTISYGPVRSGVAESVEFLVETPGEDIPHLNIRPHFKHRGIAKAFEGRTVDDGVLVAERVEGIASVAHAIAFAHAVEALTGTEVPRRAQLIRVVVAELERIANHLDVAMKLSDAAGLAVATSRFGWHKETIMRLMSQLSGSRFGRNVVIPGGVAGELGLAPDAWTAALHPIHDRITADARLAMKTPSLLDRFRGTGRLDADRAAQWGALGPVGRALGVVDDNRWSRPTGCYRLLTESLLPAHADSSDVMARLQVRWQEIDTSVQLIRRAAALLSREPGNELSVPMRFDSAAHTGIGWSEGPQGELLYVVEMIGDRISRCFARTPSLHNLVLFHDVFNGDVLTDFAFNEFSFGLSYAGVAM